MKNGFVKLPKLRVASSSLVFRSIKTATCNTICRWLFNYMLYTQLPKLILVQLLY